MFSRLSSAATLGVSAFLVTIETHLENGLPGFAVVGLPDSAVREARERVPAAIKNSNYNFPLRKITLNLAPADVRKEGSAFDLPIAVGILSAAGQVECAASNAEENLFLGELALDGSIRPIRGALSIAMEARRNGIRRIFLPAVNAPEAAMLEDVEVFPLVDLRQAVEFLNGAVDIKPLSVDAAGIFSNQKPSPFNLRDVKGQQAVKRALEVAAAGGHNLIMIGPPGSGKTMLAKRLPSVLPPLSLEEAMETTRIHSAAGMLPEHDSLVAVRPFRSPHHTISDAALVGGGVGNVRPGEISLAHHGVLFLDELPEFARNVLEVLRQPLEDKQICISRTRMTVEFPSNFMLVCSMNPCPCGNFGSGRHDCTCSQRQIQRYMSRISGPLLDRIDIHISVNSVRYQELSARHAGEDSREIRKRVVAARRVQTERFAEQPQMYKNADMDSAAIRRYCALDSESQELLKIAMTRMGLSARAFDRILKVARSIADLAGSESLSVNHVAEAIQYRSLDRQFWNA